MDKCNSSFFSEKERIALVPVSTQRAAICPSVTVDAFFEIFFLKMILADFDSLVSSLLFILELSYFLIFAIFYIIVPIWPWLLICDGARSRASRSGYLRTSRAIYSKKHKPCKLHTK